MVRGAGGICGRLLPAAALRWAATLAAASAAIASSYAAEPAWKTWSAGAPSFESPTNMSLAADATPKAAPFDLKSPDWVPKLVDLQSDPRAVVAMFEWSPNVMTPLQERPN